MHSRNLIHNLLVLTGLALYLALPTNSDSFAQGRPAYLPNGNTHPPAAPLTLAASVHGRVVDLSWTPSSEPDVIGYNVYRSGTSPVTLAGPVNGSKLLSSPKYHDLQLNYGVRYYYVVTAVNASGQESPASNEVSVTPTVDRRRGQSVPDGMVPTGALPVTSLDTAGALASAPNGPVVVAPINGATGVASPATLTVKVTDPENDAMTVTFYGRQKTSVPAPNFTVIAVGDTQSYVLDSTGAAIFTGNMRWVSDTRSVNNIAFVTALGDITMDGNNDTDNSEWNIASTAYRKLERGTPSDGSDDVPFGIAPGNHDNLGGGWTRYENTFGVARFSGRYYYGGHYGTDNTNNYSLFSASGMHFISIQLACVSSNLTSTSAVLNWADALLKADASRRGIVVCHDAMSGNSLNTDGAAVYNALRDNPNFVLLLAGHSGVGRWTGSGTDGHPIYAMMSDYTGLSQGWIRRMEFQPANNLISVKTYGPTANGGAGSYKTTSDDQFTLSYTGMQSPDFTLLGTVTNVASGSNASINWSGLLSGTQYEWYAVASDGTSSTRGSISTFTTASGGSTPTNTPTATRTSTPTPTSTSTSTSTPTPTNTLTPTPTRTSTPTPTNTLTPTPTNTSTATNTPTPIPTPEVDLIFADGFESGNLAAWTSSATGGGDLSVSTSAALVGASGLQAVINDNGSLSVTDDRPDAEPRYRARFYFDPNSISMASGDAHYIFRGFDIITSTEKEVLSVDFRWYSGSYQIRVRQQDDSDSTRSTSWVTISDAPHSIELDWQAATAAGANNGSLTLWIDGIQQGGLTGLDNDTRWIDRVRLGATAGIDTTTRGTEYFDAFESRRQTYIGP